MKKEVIGVRVSPQLKEKLEERAKEEDMSLSGYAENLLRKQVRQEISEEVQEDINAEQRLEELISIGKEEIRETGDTMRETIAKSGIYSIAVWELIKQNHSDIKRQQALSTGSKRLREDLKNLGIDPDDLEKNMKSSEDKGGSEENKNTNSGGDTDGSGVGGPKTDLF